jgi:hypothetical protein
MPHNIFRAGRTRRWHTNPDLCDTADHVDGHSGRVARILLHLWPDTSAAALRAALTHDDGEHASADVAGPIKRAWPDLAYMLHDIETLERQALWGADPDLTELERARIDFADKLDAYMWMMHHRPHLRSRPDWADTREYLTARAIVLHVSDRLDLQNPQ